MRRRTLRSVLVLCVAGLAPLGPAPLWAAEPAAGPIRLTRSQMDSITAGTAVVVTDASALVLGRGGLASTSARTSATGGPFTRIAGGGSDALAVGSLLVAASSTTTAHAGDEKSGASVTVGASGGAIGDSALAEAHTEAAAVDGKLADIAVGVARGVALGSKGSDVVVTGAAGGAGRLVAGSVSQVVRTPNVTLGVAWVFAMSIDPSVMSRLRTVGWLDRNREPGASR